MRLCHRAHPALGRQPGSIPTGATWTLSRSPPQRQETFLLVTPADLLLGRRTRAVRVLCLLNHVLKRHLIMEGRTRILCASGLLRLLCVGLGRHLIWAVERP